MSDQPFHEGQFTATQWDSAGDKAKWANAMASWATRGFPQNGWRKSLYDQLHTHMYGHIAHCNQQGFYAEWFADIHRQLAWLQYVAGGGAFGGGLGDPTYTWCDVERAWSSWVCTSGLLARYQQLCSQDIESRERALLARLQLKYQPERCDQGHLSSAGSTTPPESLDTTSRRPSHAGLGSEEPRKPRYVRFSLFD